MTSHNHHKARHDDEPQSVFLDAWLTAKGEPLANLAEHLLDAIKPNPENRVRSLRRDALQKMRFCVINIAANLAHLALSPAHVPGSILYVATAKSKPTRYDRKGYPRRHLAPVIEALEEAGFLIRNPYRFKQRTTTIEPTAKFVELLNRYRVRLGDIGRDAGGETIVLKARMPNEVNEEGKPYRGNKPPLKRLVPYADTEETIKLRAEVEQVNAMLNEATIAFDGEPVAPIQLHRSFLIRSPDGPALFNLLGRLGGGTGFWQYLKSNRRHLITIGGEGITDLDFSAMHPAMAYLRATGKLPEGDPYDIPGLEGHRAGAKRAVLSLLSRTGPMRLLAADLKAKLPEGWTAKRLVEAVSARHPAITHLFGSDIGVELMNTESRILMAVLLELASKGIPALPMHDGAMCRISDRGAALETMRTVSERMLGVALPVKEKPIWRPPTSSAIAA